MADVTGGELVARSLAAHGVTHLFGVHGGHLDPFLTAAASLDMTITDARHEASAGNAAEGYARASGKLGVAFATSGPGFANAFSALANARIDRIPMVLVTSSPPQREAELNVLQDGLDQVAASRTVAKWAHRATTVARIPDLVALAIRHACTGMPGPVVIDIPIDIMFRSVPETLVSTPATDLPAPPAPSARSVERTVELLRHSERPVVLLGGGAALSVGVKDALAQLLATCRLPVVQTSWGHGHLAPDHPCLLGGPSDLASLPFLAEPPDLFVLLGARRGIYTGGRSTSTIGADAAVVHVDIDGTEPGRIGRVDHAVVADVAEFLHALNGRVDDLPDRSEWTATALKARGAHALLYADAPPVCESGGLHPYLVAREIAATVDETTVLVFDGGEAAGWINFFATAHSPGAWFGLGQMGGLGVGQGFALGAQVARPDSRVILTTGDGAIGFHLQEFDTMMRHNLPITTVVFNNSSWAMSMHGQNTIYGPDTRVAVDLPPTRYDLIAQAMGLHGEHVTSLDEIGPAIERAHRSGRPACIDITVDSVVEHPMMAPLSDEIPDGAVRIPYYEPLPHGEI